MNKLNTQILENLDNYEKSFIVVEDNHFYRIENGTKLFSCSYRIQSDETAILTLSSGLDIFKPLQGRFNSLDGCNGTDDDKTSRVIYLNYDDINILKEDILTILFEII